MVEYKVIALSVGGVGNQIFHSGDKKKEEDFYPGTIVSLIKGGYIVPVNGTAPEPAKPEPSGTSDLEEEELQDNIVEMDSGSDDGDMFESDS